MANPNRWVKLYNVAGAANRFRWNGEERRETQRRAMMVALAHRPHEARTRAWEAQIPADVDAPMHQVNDALAQIRPREALTRTRQAADIWPALDFPGGPFNMFE